MLKPILMTATVLLFAMQMPSWCHAQQPWIETSSFVHPEQPDTFVFQTVLHYGGSNAFATQAQFSFGGIVVVIDDPTEGSKTEPSGEPDPNAPEPPRNGSNDAEHGVAVLIVRDGYVITQQPTIPEDDPFRDDYPTSNPDYKIEDHYFDLYSPANSTPANNVADNVDTKIGSQVDHVIIEFPTDATDERVQEVIDAIQGKRDTPDTATRDDLEEIWIIKPDRTIERIFPDGRLK